MVIFHGYVSFPEGNQNDQKLTSDSSAANRDLKKTKEASNCTRSRPVVDRYHWWWMVINDDTINGGEYING